jgi:CBS domain containing-hemolysin-like protein
LTIEAGAVAIVLPLLAFVALTAANAFFVAAEFSLVTVDRATVDQLADSGDPAARTVRRALRSLSFQLSGAQLGITITALLTGYLAEPALAKLFAPLLRSFGSAQEEMARFLALGLATLLSMLFGELVPKNAAIARPWPAARRTAGPMRAFSTVFGWLIHALNGSANWLVRRLGVEPQEELASARSPEELGLLAAYSAKAGALPEETALLLRRTIRFGEKRAAEAMTPRVDVIGVEAGVAVQDVIDLVRQTGKSRFPVYEQTLDQVVGIITVIEALGVPPPQRATTPARAVAAEPVLVPESLDLDRVLATLQLAGADIAIVVDEYGGTDGVVTIEDLVEEVVGDIADEFDVEPSLATVAPPGGATILGSDGSAAERTGPGGAHADAGGPAAGPVGAEVTVPRAEQSWLVDGVLRADELDELTGFRLPDGPYETLAGFLMAELGHIPVTGETVARSGWEFTVTDVNRRRVEQVRVVAPGGDG